MPKEIKEKGQITFRSITIDQQELEFSKGFTELHTESYKGVLKVNGFGLKDSEESIKIVHEIRNMEIRKTGGKYLFVK